MSVRPLIQKSILDLEKIFSEAQHDQASLKRLKTELKHRKRARALTLLRKVEDALVEFERSSEIAPVSTRIPNLISTSSEKSAQSTSTKTVEESTEDTKPVQILISASDYPPVINIPEIVPQTEHPEQQLQSSAPVSLTLEQAYSVLGVSSSSSWEIIEQTRRTLVEKTRPDLITALSDKQKEKVWTEANHVNQAYTILARARIKTTFRN